MSFNQLVRVLYKNGLLLTGDLCNIEQTYTKNLTLNQNNALFQSGVVTGLSVRTNADNTSLTIEAGMALDGMKQQLVLAADSTFTISSDQPDGDLFIRICYGENIDPVTSLIVEQPLLELTTTAPAEPNVTLAKVTVQKGIIITLLDMRTYIKFNDAISNANNIPGVLIFPFSVTVPAPASNTADQVFVCDIPANIPFTASQIIVSVQDENNTAGVFSVSISNLTKTQFTANIHYYAFNDMQWTASIILNCIAWKI